MSRAGKAAEPSMEEILSSIRKIISEEPVGAAAPAVHKAAVDDVLGMADDAPASDVTSGGDSAKSEGVKSAGPIPAWLFPTAQLGGDAPTLSPEPADVAREVPKPFFRAAGPSAESAAPTSAASTRVGTNGVHPRAAAERATAERATAGAGQSEDLGAVVPRRSPEPNAAPAAGVTERRTPQAGLPEWLSRASGAAARPVAAPQPVPPPAEPTRMVARDPDVATPALSELAKPAVPAESITIVAVTAALAPEAAVATVVSAIDVVTEPDAMSAELHAAASEKAATAVVITDAASHNSVPKPTLLGERARSSKSNGATDVVPTVAQAGAVRTLDDTIVDLLRPMIRQWLDDNMPRMVEKALRVEMAASVKPKADQSKH